MHAPLQTDNPSTIYLPKAPTEGKVVELTDADQQDLLEFLRTHSLEAAYLMGLVLDNGVVSQNNRGVIHGYRNNHHRLEGVALIGHAILIEAVNYEAIRAFAETAQRCTSAQLILCEENRMDEFWRVYAQAGQEMRRASRQLLFELRWPAEVAKPNSALRLATLDDLELLMPVHAEMALAESGVDPRVADPDGFALRYSKRIERGRTWVSMIDKQLVFKAEVVNETPSVTQLEGIWVNPDFRRQRYGLGCMSQLAKMLLWRTKSLCLLVNDENQAARDFARQAGYHLRGVYDSIFLK